MATVKTLYVKKRRYKIKEMAITYKGGKCCLCGYNKTSKALDFHHISEEEKSFSISGGGYRKSWEEVKSELDKCILVCANCHREIHDELHDKEYLKSFLNDTYEDRLNELLISQTPETQIHTCPICNTTFTSKNPSQVFCSNSCKGKARRVTTKPSKEELKVLIKEKPFTYIGVMYGVSDNAVRKWCKSYELPYTRKGIKEMD